MSAPPPFSQHNSGQDRKRTEIPGILEASMDSLPEDSMLLKVLTTSNAENHSLSMHDVLMAAVADITSKDKQVAKLARAKDRVVDNLKAKKTEIQTLHTSHSQSKIEARNATEQLGTVRSEHECLNAAHNQLKNKIFHMQMSAKESHATAQIMEQRLAREQKLRGLEQAVLDQFRELGHHTGYHKWGKSIRLVEGNLAAALEEEK